MERYIYQGGKKLRCGYTTGSSATGASLGALLNLLGHKKEGLVIRALNGWDIPLTLHNQIKDEDSAVASIIKDPGDDPDITKGLHIYAKVRLGKPTDDRRYFVNEKGNIYLTGGEGVGRVTKKGLQVDVGYPAINKGPRRMIFETLEKYLEDDMVVTVEVSIPRGEEVAKKTFNPKLGIVDGLSVLGSTGIVKPMSEAALIDSIKAEVSVYSKEKGIEEIALTFGNYGKKFIVENTRYSEGEIVVTSNFIGDIIDEVARLKFKRIYLAGHIGKFIKLAGGIFNTHSRVADARLEILTSCAMAGEERYEVLKKVLASNTTEEAVGYIENKKTWSEVERRAKKYLTERTFGEIEIEVDFFSFEEGRLNEG